MPERLTITRPQLADALRRWEEEAREAGWLDRTDAARHHDNADYLFSLLKPEEDS